MYTDRHKNLYQPGSVWEGRTGPRRRIVSYKDGDVTYQVLDSQGNGKGRPRICWCTTFENWATGRVESMSGPVWAKSAGSAAAVPSSFEDDRVDAELAEDVAKFLKESLSIEGITREPTTREIDATVEFLNGPLSLASLLDLQKTYTPGKPLRNLPGFNVTVGGKPCPSGGPNIEQALVALIEMVNELPEKFTPLRIHRIFETIHPFMDGNGRTGRALWVWHMRKLDRNPFALSFLHRWYYDSLADYKQGTGSALFILGQVPEHVG